MYTKERNAQLNAIFIRALSFDCTQYTLISHILYCSHILNYYTVFELKGFLLLEKVTGFCSGFCHSEMCRPTHGTFRRICNLHANQMRHGAPWCTFFSIWRTEILTVRRNGALFSKMAHENFTCAPFFFF